MADSESHTLLKTVSSTCTGRVPQRQRPRAGLSSGLIHRSSMTTGARSGGGDGSVGMLALSRGAAAGGSSAGPDAGTPGRGAAETAAQRPFFVAGDDRLAERRTAVAPGPWFSDSAHVMRIGLAYETDGQLEKGLEVISDALRLPGYGRGM